MNCREAEHRGNRSPRKVNAPTNPVVNANRRTVVSVRALRHVGLRALAVLLIILSVPTRTVAQSGTSNGANNQTEWHFRYELFQMLLEQSGLKISSRSEAFAHPEESVIVNLGAIYGSLPPADLERFCVKGGIVLLATDQDYFAGRLGRVHGGPVESPEVADRYQGFRDCLKVTNLERDHPLMQGVNSLVVNRSGWLKSPVLFNSKWSVAARLPDNCTPRISSSQPILGTIDSKRTGETRMILCADPSLFTNGMMWHGDNAFLAINTAKLLADGRHQLHFVVNDAPQPTYEQSPLLNAANQQTPPLPDELPETTLNAMLRVANSVISRVDESNVLNEGLANRPRNLAQPLFRRLLFFALAGIALLIAIWRLTANGPSVHRTMPSRPMRSALALNGDQKMQASELGLSASILAREFCTKLTNSSDPAVWFRQLSGNASSGKSIVRDASLQKRLSPVVEVAVNPRNARFSVRKFEDIGKAIVELRDLHEQGRLVTTEAEVPAS